MLRVGLGLGLLLRLGGLLGRLLSRSFLCLLLLTSSRYRSGSCSDGGALSRVSGDRAHCCASCRAFSRPFHRPTFRC